MSEASNNLAVGVRGEIRILGINREKTRRVDGSDSAYRVYFELSEAPSALWRETFDREWKTLIPAELVQWQEAGVDGRFLVIHCALQDVANSSLPQLKDAVASTNASHTKHVEKQVAEQERQVKVWRQERKSVNDMADSLSFD